MPSRTMPPTTSFGARTASLAAIRTHLRAAARAAGLRPEAIDDVELAVDEACANIIEHAYPGRADGTLEVGLALDAASLVVTLTDWGQPFSPSAYRLPDLDQVRSLVPGGRGIFLMRSLMDTVEYRPRYEDRNELILVKHLT